MTYQDICDIITDKSVDWLGEYYRTPMAGFGGYTLAALREHRKVIVELPEAENGEFWCSDRSYLFVDSDGLIVTKHGTTYGDADDCRRFAAALLAAADAAEADQ